MPTQSKTQHHSKFHKYISLFFRFRQLRLMTMMEYRGDFFFWTFVSVMWTAFNFFFYSLIVGVRGSLGGWSGTDIYVLLSVFTILDAFTWGFFYHNMRYLTEAIFSGDLSQSLTKPIDPQYLVSVQDNSYTNVMRLFIGVGMLLWTIHRGHVVLTLPSLALFLFFLGISLLFLYSIWFFVATLAFWVEKLDNINEIVPAARQIWQVPRSIYVGIASTIFTVLVPLGLITSLPSEIILGRNPFWLTLYFALFSIGLFILGRQFFFLSLKKYTSVGN